MATKVVTYYKGLPPWGRGVVVVGGAVVAVIVVAKIYKGIKNKIAENNAMLEAQQSASDLKDLIGMGVNPTYPNSQYESWSNQLVQAFTGCGTDVDAVYSIFKNIQNEADILKLISTYGIRPYDKCMHWIYLFGGGVQNLSLPGAMTSELSSSDIDNINNLLASKGIKYRF